MEDFDPTHKYVAISPDNKHLTLDIIGISPYFILLENPYFVFSENGDDNVRCVSLHETNIIDGEKYQIWETPEELSYCSCCCQYLGSHAHGN